MRERGPMGWLRGWLAHEWERRNVHVIGFGLGTAQTVCRRCGRLSPTLRRCR